MKSDLILLKEYFILLFSIISVRPYQGFGSSLPISAKELAKGLSFWRKDRFIIAGGIIAFTLIIKYKAKIAKML